MMNGNTQDYNSSWYHHRRISLGLRIALWASVVTFSANTYAHQEFDIISGQSWQASTVLPDGTRTNWINAFAPYPNGITMPNPNQNGTNQPNPGATNGQLMWYWDPSNGIPTGRNGPTNASFRYTFDYASTSIPPCPQPGPIGAPPVPCAGGNPIGAWVAADDWMQLRVNGHLTNGVNISGQIVDAYILDDNKLQNGQPKPMFMGFDNFLIQGANTLEIEAKDGCFSLISPDCQLTGLGERDLLYEYVFFDAQQLSNPGAAPIFISLIPEPASITLLVVGFGALTAIRRLSHRAKV